MHSRETLTVGPEQLERGTQGPQDFASGLLVSQKLEQLASCKIPVQMKTGGEKSLGLKSCFGRSFGCDAESASPGQLEERTGSQTGSEKIGWAENGSQKAGWPESGLGKPEQVAAEFERPEKDSGAGSV